MTAHRCFAGLCADVVHACCTRSNCRVLCVCVSELAACYRDGYDRFNLDKDGFDR